MTTNVDMLTQHAIARVTRQFPVVHLHKPDLSDVPAGTIIGGSVWSKLRHARWIVNPAVHIGNGLTYADLARSWIEINIPKLPLKRKRDDEPIEHAPVPHLARVGEYHDVAYVDIKSTYRTILETCGFDVEYRAGQWLSRGNATSGLDDLPKIAYSAIVTLSIRYYRTIRETTRDGSFRTRQLRNKYANVALYALVRDILHAIYSDVVSSVYVYYANTDGYIVKMSDVERVGQIINDWGFEFGVKKSGTARIYGVANYTFNTSSSRRRVSQGKFTDLVSPVFRDWLHARWSRLVLARDKVAVGV